VTSCTGLHRYDPIRDRARAEAKHHNKRRKRKQS